MVLYYQSFAAAFCLSALFATGGVGSAIILIPVLSMMGVNFDLSKAAGLLVNTITTTTASTINYRRGVLDVKGTIPFLFTSAITAPLGVQCAQRCETHYMKMFFAGFLFISAYLMVKKKTGEFSASQGSTLLMYPLGAVVGFMADLLGIGGGAIIIPALFYMHYPPGKIASTVSFMIPLSTFIAFISYAVLIPIDWFLIATVSVAAAFGGHVGTLIRHRYLKDKQIKNVLAAILFIIGIKLFWGVINS